MIVIRDHLKDGILTPDLANQALNIGIPWNEVAPYVDDEAWWYEQPVTGASISQCNFQILSYGATLHLQVDGFSIWVDPGPQAPIPEVSPTFILLTHAHRDHYDKLPVFLEKFPETPVVMHRLTRRILKSIYQGTYPNPGLQPNIVEMDFGKHIILRNFEIKCYRAGHVLGAAMFSLGHDDTAILVTGDFTLRQVGGIEGAEIPDAPFHFVALNVAGTGGPGSFPRADPKTNHQRILSEINRRIEKRTGHFFLSCKALGEAQEIYASLIEAQRLGWFDHFRVRLAGFAHEWSSLYFEECNSSSDNKVWKFPPCELIDWEDRSSIGIIPEGLLINSSMMVNVYYLNGVNTHASWSELMTFAASTPCQTIGLYDGANNHLLFALKKMGKELRYIPNGKEFFSI